MGKIQILNHWTKAVIYEAEVKTLREAVVKAACEFADLTRADLAGADLAGADLTDANLTGADLTGADLTDANLTGANLTRANLTGANLTGANLTGANLTRAKMPGFADALPTSLADAALRTKEWLAGEHWCQASWIKTPTGAYAGDCLACLHGAAVYVGGPEYGPPLSQKLVQLGYTVEWNDENGRTLPEVLAALDHVVREEA